MGAGVGQGSWNGPVGTVNDFGRLFVTEQKRIKMYTHAEMCYGCWDCVMYGTFVLWMVGTFVLRMAHSYHGWYVCTPRSVFKVNPRVGQEPC